METYSVPLSVPYEWTNKISGTFGRRSWTPNVFKLDCSFSFSNGGYSSLVFKTKFRKFCKKTPKCTEREGSTRLPVAGAGGVPLCHFDLRYPASGSVFSYWSTEAWFWGVNRFNCLAYKDIFAVELLGLIASDTRTHTPGLRRPGGRFSKVPIINGPGKLSQFTLRIEVSILLHLSL